jgi:hypothetical protein
MKDGKFSDKLSCSSSPLHGVGNTVYWPKGVMLVMLVVLVVAVCA